MDQIEIVDREYSKVKNESNKQEDSRVRLTEKSKTKIDIVFLGAINKMKKSHEYEEKAKEMEKRIVEANVPENSIKGILMEMELIELKEKQYKYSDKAYGSYRKAIRIKEFMKTNIVSKFNKFVNSIRNKFDVGDVTVSSINELFEKEENSRKYINLGEVAENVNDITAEKLQEEIENSFKNEEIVNPEENSIPSVEQEETYQENESKTQFNLVNEFDKIIENQNSKQDEFENKIVNEQENKEENNSTLYSLTAKDIIQDDVMFNKPILDDLALNQSVEGTINEDVFSIPNITVEKEEKREENLYTKVTNSLENEETTIDDLEKLRQALEIEKNKQDDLKDSLEKTRIQAETAEKEAVEAEKLKEEKIRLANEKLAAYRAENERLKSQKEKVEIETLKKVSVRQAAMNQIEEIDKMLGTGATVSKEISSIKK